MGPPLLTAECTGGSTPDLRAFRLVATRDNWRQADAPTIRATFFRFDGGTERYTWEQWELGHQTAAWSV